VPAIVGGTIDLAGLAGAAVVAVATIGSIVPGDEEGAVVGIEFVYLGAIGLDVFGCAILRIVAIPGRAVEAHLHAQTIAGLAVFLYHIPVAVAPGAFCDIVSGSLCRPETETVVVFGNDDHAFEAAGLRRTDDLPGVEVDRVDHFRVFVTIPPFLVGIGVDTEV